MAEVDVKELEKTKKKKANGFGMLKGSPSFKEDEEEHEDLW